jgi:cytochrome c
MDRVLFIGIILMVIVAGLAVIQEKQTNTLQMKQTKTLVDSAVQEIQKNGELAFTEFNSFPWYIGDSYVFVWRTNGVRVVYPPDPKAVGQNMANLKDATGKPIGKIFIHTANKDGGTVEYLWPKPGTNIPVTKVTYIKKVKYQNKTYIVGSGYYVQ